MDKKLRVFVFIQILRNDRRKAVDQFNCIQMQSGLRHENIASAVSHIIWNNMEGISLYGIVKKSIPQPYEYTVYLNFQHTYRVGFLSGWSKLMIFLHPGILCIRFTLSIYTNKINKISISDYF